MNTFSLYTIPLFFVGMWLFVSFILAQLGGWSALAKHYRREATYNGGTVLASGSVGMTNYNNALLVGADENYLHLATFFLFRFAHPSLSIPWSSIHVSSERRFFIRSVRFEVDNIVVTVRLSSIQRLGRKQKLPRVLASLGE